MASSGDFLMKLSMGTPPFEIMGILCTGSVITWTQCAPCDNCYPQNQPLFTQEIVNLQRAAWKFKTLQMPWMEVFYFWRPRHAGILCSIWTDLVVMELSPRTQSPFYLRSSKIHFGSNSVVSGASVVSNGLHIFRNSYALSSKGISVGKKKLATTRMSITTYSSVLLLMRTLGNCPRNKHQESSLKIYKGMRWIERKKPPGYSVVVIFRTPSFGGYPALNKVPIGNFADLAEIARFLGITTTIDIEAIQGHGSYEDRTQVLRLILHLVEASIYADNPEWSVDETYN
ncbi:AUGMIN subunit [Sesamum alatum]|uniref:AUGMIN subunit n=1 Tax=Sesamum alatum TaxID=300844 RepID=A0AAE1Y340_9LAMI|nr:AUGMIN subunit [Sesamum alatum]